MNYFNSTLFSKKLNIQFIYYLAIAPILSFITTNFFGFKIWGAFTLGAFIAIFSIFTTQKFTISKPTKWFFLFFIYTIISDILIVKASIFNLSFFLKNKILLSLVILIIIDNTYLNDTDLKKYLKINKNIFIVALLILFIQYLMDPTFWGFLGNITNEGETIETDIRFGSIYETLSGIEIGFMPFALLTFYSFKFYYDEKNKKMAYVLIVLGFIISLINGSRWILLNMFIITFGILTKFRILNLKGAYKIILASLVIVLLSITIYKSSSSFQQFVDRRITEQSKGGIEMGSAYSRVLAWEVFKELFPKNPIWGKGRFHFRGDLPENIEDTELLNLIGGSSQMHVGYLSLFYYYGLVGGIIFLMFLLSLYNKLYIEYRIHQDFSFLLIYTTYLIANLTLVYLQLNLIGLIFILIMSKSLKVLTINETNKEQLQLQ